MCGVGRTTNQGASDVRRGHGKYHVAPKADRTYNGVVYHSKAEARRAVELDLLLRAGKIQRWESQPAFYLTSARIKYVADFHVLGLKAPWIEDVKGMLTPRFRMIVKLWRAYGNFPLVILHLHKEPEWILPTGMEIPI